MEPITRRRFLGQAGIALAGAAAGSHLRSALGGPDLATRSSAASGVVAPLAYSGGLPKCTLRLAIPSGPEADAHVALASEFTKYSKGKVTVEVEQYGRDDQYEEKYLTLMRAKSSEWDIVRVVPLDFLLWGPNGWLMPFTKYMNDPKMFNAQVFNFHDYLPALVDLISYKGQVYSFIQEAERDAPVLPEGPVGEVCRYNGTASPGLVLRPGHYDRDEDGGGNEGGRAEDLPLLL